MAFTELLSGDVQRMRELKRQIDTLSAELDGIQSEIKDYMTLKNIDVIDGPDYKITWKSVLSSRFDSKAFKAAHADLYSQFTVASESRRFTLT